MGTRTRIKAICLLSGGLDSVTVLGIALRDGYDVSALTIHYGQLHEKEIESAERIAKHFKVEHTLSRVSMPWGGSALLDPLIPLPKGRSEIEMQKDIPVSYVPARNTIFLSLAASYAEAKSAEAIFIGANAIDYSGYPDCRPVFFEAFEKVLLKGTKYGVEGKQIHIKTPLLRLTKAEIIKLGYSLQIPYELTWSCYEGGEIPCGECDSCRLRTKGFQEAGFEDPLLAKK